MKLNNYFLVLGMAVAFPAFADCHADIEPVKAQFIAVHDNLSEADHMSIENVLSEAVSFCYANQEDDAQTKIAEAKKLLANY